ncbi:MAG: zinc-ribbon domain-containing protein, partial [Litorilinea sp.]
MRCPYCQTENPAGSTTCENCGRDLTATTDAETPEQERGARVGMGVIALVLLVAAILVAGVLLFTRQQRQREQVAQATAVAVGALSTATAQAELSAGLEATAIAQATRAAMAAADSAPTATYEALDARYQRGISAAEIGDYATAVEEFRAVLAVDPDFADAASRLQAALAVLTPAPGEDAPDVPATTTALPAGDATPIPVRPTNTNTPTPGSQTGASTATPLP